MDTALASQQARALHQCLTRLEAKQREIGHVVAREGLALGELLQRLLELDGLERVRGSHASR